VFFRHMYLRRLSGYVKRNTAVVCSGLLFALFHELHNLDLQWRIVALPWRAKSTRDDLVAHLQFLHSSEPKLRTEIDVLELLDRNDWAGFCKLTGTMLKRTSKSAGDLDWEERCLGAIQTPTVHLTNEVDPGAMADVGAGAGVEVAPPPPKPFGGLFGGKAGQMTRAQALHRFGVTWESPGTMEGATQRHSRRLSNLSDQQRKQAIEAKYNLMDRLKEEKELLNGELEGLRAVADAERAALSAAAVPWSHVLLEAAYQAPLGLCAAEAYVHTNGQLWAPVLIHAARNSLVKMFSEWERRNDAT